MQRVAGVVLEGDEIALAALLARVAVAALEHRTGTAPAPAVALRDRLAAFAAETTQVVVSGPRESAKPPGGAVVSGCLMSAREAAGVAGVSEQTVRAWCRAGEVIAVRDRAGWLIDAGSVAAEAARRKEARGVGGLVGLQGPAVLPL